MGVLSDKDRDLIIEFYDGELWDLGMPHGDGLTDKDLVFISKTAAYAVWVLNNNFEHAVQSIRDAINSVRR